MPKSRPTPTAATLLWLLVGLAFAVVTAVCAWALAATTLEPLQAALVALAAVGTVTALGLVIRGRRRTRGWERGNRTNHRLGQVRNLEVHTEPPVPDATTSFDEERHAELERLVQDLFDVIGPEAGRLVVDYRAADADDDTERPEPLTETIDRLVAHIDALEADLRGDSGHGETSQPTPPSAPVVAGVANVAGAPAVFREEPPGEEWLWLSLGMPAGRERVGASDAVLVGPTDRGPLGQPNDEGDVIFVGIAPEPRESEQRNAPAKVPMEASRPRRNPTRRPARVMTDAPVDDPATVVEFVFRRD